MGLILSQFLGSAEPEPPPSVVLVPPLLERERKGRSRFAKSSYDRWVQRYEAHFIDTACCLQVQQCCSYARTAAR